MEANQKEDTLNNGASGFFERPDGKLIEIKDVWASNFEEEMEKIREVVSHHPYVAMDTEFPGIVAYPVAEYGSNTDVQYQTLKINVDLLKLIQLGLTFSDEEGNFVNGCTCWQFNFKFSLSGDIYASDSIELLKTSGIDFDKFERFGIDIQQFGEAMMIYDFGYLLKTLTGTELPSEENGFLELLHTFFPSIYDVKYMMTAVEGLYGGLSTLADLLDVPRIGPMHQAGSDSLLTSMSYFKLVQKYFMNTNNNCSSSNSGVTSPKDSKDASSNSISSGIASSSSSNGSSCNLNLYDDSRFVGELFGMGTNHTKYKKYGGAGMSSIISSNALPPIPNSSNSTTGGGIGERISLNNSNVALSSSISNGNMLLGNISGGGSSSSVVRSHSITMITNDGIAATTKPQSMVTAYQNGSSTSSNSGTGYAIGVGFYNGASYDTNDQ